MCRCVRLLLSAGEMVIVRPEEVVVRLSLRPHCWQQRRSRATLAAERATVGVREEVANCIAVARQGNHCPIRTRLDLQESSWRTGWASH